MKLIQLTAKRLQSVTADNLYIINLARSFSKILNNDFQLVVASKEDKQLREANVLNLKLSIWFNKGLFYFIQPYIYYFFWLPVYIKNNSLNKTDVVFFSSDPNLLFLLICWRKFFFHKYKICSDWHMLFYNFKDKFNAVNSDFLITTSNKLKKLIVEKSGTKEEKIKTVYGGVNLENFTEHKKEYLRRELSLPLDKILVGYVGFFKTIGMSKGIDTMISTLLLLDEKIVMVFAGGKNDEISEYQNMAKILGVEKRCIFTERVSMKLAARYQKAMDILVIPYPDKPHFRDFCFPMKVYEYMAAQMPIIYSKLELAEEVLLDCGYLFKPDDPKDLADVIIDVIKNYSSAEEKARLAYDKLPNYSWQVKAQNIINFIKS